MRARLAQHQIPLLICIMLLAGMYTLLHRPSPALAEKSTQDAPFYRYYPLTGHNVSGPFLQFYDANGGSTVFGLPITEMIQERDTGLFVQYFEYARFEYDPAQPDDAAIRLTPLGSKLTAERQDTVFRRQSVQDVVPRAFAFSVYGVRFFEKTGHSLRGDFHTFWKTHGGLDVFGYPISEPLLEEIDGTLYLVQYFENARLEYHPGKDGSASHIQPGRLGYTYLQQQELPVHLLAPASEMTALGEGVTPYYGEESTDGHNILLAARNINGRMVMPGEAMSFLDGVGPITAEAGFMNGYGILGGEITTMMGGGICQTSSALYEAAFSAGLEILERHNHSYVLSFFSNQPGIEAAVFDGGSYRQDLRWRNDTASPIYVMTSLDRTDKLLRVSLWGVPDGRAVQVGTPAVLSTTAADEVWILDEEMEEGTFEQQNEGSNGMTVAVWRHVVSRDGQMLHEDRVVTSYAPVDTVFYHGVGGNPNEEPECDDPENDDPACSGLECDDPENDDPACEEAEAEEAESLPEELPVEELPTEEPLPAEATPEEPAPEAPAPPQNPAPVQPITGSPISGGSSAPPPAEEEPAPPPPAEEEPAPPPDTMVQEPILPAPAP